MAIARKPKRKDEKSYVNVDAFINKGGSIAKISEASAIEKQVALRVPASILTNIDGIVRQRTVRIPRHTWILEAIAEKMERETTGTA